MVGLPSRLQPNGDDVAAKVIEGEAIIINLTSGMYYSLDGAGAVVWEFLVQGRSVGEVAEVVAKRYQVAVEQAREDTTRLAAEFVTEGLMRPLDIGSVPTASPQVAGDGSGTAAPLPYAVPRLQKYADMADLLALDPPLPGLAKNPWADAEGKA